MGLETFTYISSFNSANPVASDNASQGDDHIRGMKSAVLATFPNITGAVTPTHTQLNQLGSTNTFTGAVKCSAGTIYSYGFTADNNIGVFFANSAGTQYLQNNNNVWTQTGSFQSAGLIRGNGGGSGLGAITVSTSAPSGGAAGDLWFQY